MEQKESIEHRPHKKTVILIWVVILVLLAAAAVVAVLLLTGHWTSSLKQSAQRAEENLPKMTKQSQPISASTETTTKKYRDDKASFEMTYPEDWQEFARHEGLVDSGEAYQITNDTMTLTAATADAGELGHGGATLYITKRLDPSASTAELAGDLKNLGYEVLKSQKINDSLVRLYCVVGSESGSTLVVYWWHALPESSRFTGLWIAGPMIRVPEFENLSPPDVTLTPEETTAAAQRALDAGIDAATLDKITQDEEVAKSIIAI